MENRHPSEWSALRNTQIPGEQLLGSSNSAGARAGLPRISYLRLAWTHKLLLIVFMVLGTMAGTAYVVLKTPHYRASATVELVGFNQSFMGMSQVDPQAGTDTTTASVSNIQTQTRI